MAGINYDELSAETFGVSVCHGVLPARSERPHGRQKNNSCALGASEQVNFAPAAHGINEAFLEMTLDLNGIWVSRPHAARGYRAFSVRPMPSTKRVEDVPVERIEQFRNHASLSAWLSGKWGRRSVENEFPRDFTRVP
jgi:hypothetical protein